MPANRVENEIIDRSSMLACKLNDDVIRGNTRWLGIKLFIRISRITRITRGREWMIVGKGMRLLENREIKRTENRERKRERERVKGRGSDGSFNETFVNFWLPVELESSRALDIRSWKLTTGHLNYQPDGKLRFPFATDTRYALEKV